jgi:succinoglycan biosynthesis transport protein ExoP
LMQAEADRIQLQSYLNKFNGEGSGSLPQISSNPVVQALTQKLAETRAELAQTLAIYGKNHPNSQKLQNQVDELQSQLRAQRSAILSDLRTSYSAAQAREQLMQSQVKGTSKQLELLAKYGALKKEADANTELYNNLFQKIKEAGIAAESKSSNIRVVDPARVLDSPTRPHRMINIAVGLLAGILGGVILAFVRDVLDTRIRTAEDVKKCLGTGSVSIVPAIGGDGTFKLFGKATTQYAQVFLLNRPNSPEAEALRGLYTSVRLSRQGGTPQALLVLSPHAGEGKTTLAVNLGLALAQHGRTCIVDADMRKQGVAPALGVQARHGLGDVLLGALPLEQVLVPAEDMPNLTILPAGGVQADPGALISSSAMADLVRQLRQQYEFVIIDSAPILPFADGRALSALVDGVVLVGRAGVTTREALVRAMELLQDLRSAPVVEVVLNGAEYPATDYRYYRQYGYGKTA